MKITAIECHLLWVETTRLNWIFTLIRTDAGITGVSGVIMRRHEFTVREAILRGNHALVLHEYWADLGPSEHWGWWGGRSLKCPWAVPIVIGECGFEMAVKRGGLPAKGRR